VGTTKETMGVLINLLQKTLHPSKNPKKKPRMVKYILLVLHIYIIYQILYYILYIKGPWTQGHDMDLWVRLETHYEFLPGATKLILSF